MREYLGIGYVHRFVHNGTGAIIYTPCTEAEYTRLGLPGGSQYNPVMEGYTWECSLGGTAKVDTPNTLLGADEYCVKDGKALVYLPDTPEGEHIIELTSIVGGKLDDSLVISIENSVFT